MTPEERDLITGLFGRLRAADTATKDRDAEDLIRRAVADFPAAPYLLAQTVLVQEHALAGAQARIAELEKQVNDAKAAAPDSGGSFLGGLTRRFAPQAPARPSYRVPDTQPAQPAYAQPAYTQPPVAQPGGCFLHNAMATAAGVAGGALLFEGIQRMMGHTVGPFSGGYMGSSFGGSPWGQPAENVVVNNYYDNDAQPGTQTADYNTGGSDPSIQDADYDTSSDTDSGGDFGDSGGGMDYT